MGNTPEVKMFTLSTCSHCIVGYKEDEIKDALGMG